MSGIQIVVRETVVSNGDVGYFFVFRLGYFLGKGK